MNIKKLTSLIASLVFVGLFNTAQTEDKKPEMTPEMQEQMKKMKENGTPGAEHEVLKAFEGKWTVTSKSWMNPGDAAQESKGSSTFTWVLDGRFLRQDFKGDWAGQPFTGLGFIGYDKVKKEYTSIWMDNMMTGIMKSTGQYDAATKTIIDGGTFSCPMTGEKDMAFRAEWKIVSQDENTYSMFMKDKDGKEFKTMEITYKRAK